METKGQLLVEQSIGGYEDVILARQRVRDAAAEIGFNLLDQTRIVTAVSELGRNIVVHAGHGRMFAYSATGKPGLVVLFEDQGPGIPDTEQALRDGYSTAGSLGLGLSGARKLTDQMHIRSNAGKGTRVEIVKWLR